MRFAPSPEQTDFARSLRRLLEAADVPAVARAWADGDADPGRKLWRRLAELGLHGLLREGGSPVELVLAFEELGRAGAPGPYVESVSVLPALLTGTEREAVLDAVGAGEAIATLAFPPHVPFALDADVAEHVFAVVPGPALVPATSGDEIRSVDPTRKLHDVRPADSGSLAVDAEYGFDAGALATASQIYGAGRAVLDMATAYAKQREQFGRPIGSFQAVKHQLADALVALDLAGPLLFGAALAMGTATQARDVSAAKVSCTDAAHLAGRVALQVHGAIGYTAEFDLALWLTKIRALTFAWGTQQVHRNRVLDSIR
jgi:hypothetical protein